MTRIRSILQRVRPASIALLPWLVWATAVGCADDSRNDPLASLPAGSWVTGNSAEARELLLSLESLTGSPLEREARAVRARIESCGLFLGHTSQGDLPDLVASITCASTAEVPAPLQKLRGDHSAAFVLRVGEQARLVGSLHRAGAQKLVVDAHLDAHAASGLARLLIPDDEPAGPNTLSARDTLIHARVRAASGIDLGSIVTEGSQGDRMFRLRSELFLGHVLDGSWELAVYMPSDERLTPPMAIALDHSMRSVAESAMEEFVGELEQTWPIHAQEQRFGAQRGACIFDVRILPDLAPCYVVSERSIIVGWNPESIRAALVDEGDAASQIGRESGVVVHLDRLPEADRRLRMMLGQEAGAEVPVRSSWQRLRIEGRPSAAGAQAVELHMELSAPVTAEGSS